MLLKTMLRRILPAALLLTLVLAACMPAPAAPSAAPAATGAPAPDPTVAPQAEAPAAAVAPAATGGPVAFVIDPARSSVRFILTEMLRGAFTVVTGEGNGIAGAVTIDLADYSATTIGPIEIDARTLATDNGMRNQAIGRFILQHNQEQNRTIRFTPTAIEGLPASASVGQPFEFTVTGDLSIRTVTQPVTFVMTVTPVSANEIQGSGSTVVLRSDFDLQIPSVPSVADVSQEVTLEIDFVAVAAQ